MLGAGGKATLQGRQCLDSTFEPQTRIWPLREKPVFVNIPSN